MSNNVVELVDVWKTYRSGRLEFSALRGVSLEVVGKEMLAVVGPSGSGKTTLLNIMGTLDRPTRGSVRLLGVSVENLGSSRLAEIRNRVVGFVFQTFNLISYLTVEANVELPMMVAGVPGSQRKKRVRELLESLGIAKHAGKRPVELSGGEQQRVAIARALANNPRVVLADEPTGNLDSSNARMVMEILDKIRDESGVSVVLVTHNLELVRYADRVAYLRDGRIERVVS
jgi:putative ABC transport system ATP-binding protein